MMDYRCIGEGCRFPFSALTLLVGRQEGNPVCKTGRWFVDGDILTAALHVYKAPGVTTDSTIFRSDKSRMETFWYRLTQVHLEMAVKTEFVCLFGV